MDLTPGQRKALEKVLSDLYDELQANLLGRFFKGPQVWVEVARSASPSRSIEGLFRYALKMMYGPGADVPEDRLRQLATITSNYMDAEKLKAINKVLAEADQAKDAKDLRGRLEEVIEEMTSKVHQLVATETRNASNFAEREGIMQVAAPMGIDDPTVARLGPHDAKTCRTCLKLWHDDKNPMIPKIYKSSEIQGGYSTHKDPKPTWNATHPHCRHVWIMVAPNYGFDDTGRLKFMGFGHDEFKTRRKGLKKFEPAEPCWEPDHDHHVTA
jgi:hypothetical protein